MPVATPGNAWNRDGLRRWDFGEIPADVSVRIAGVSVRMYPAIEDAGDAIRLRLLPSAAQATRATRDGVTRLAALAMPQQHELVRRSCASDRELVLLTAAAGMGRALFGEIADRAVADAIDASGRGAPRSAAEFDDLVDSIRSVVAGQGDALQRCARKVLAALKDVRSALDALGTPAFAFARDSISAQVAALLPPGWMRRTPDPWLGRLPKYLGAASRRAVRVRDAVERDRMLHDQLVPYESALRELEPARAGESRPAAERERLRWMLEEFRVSLFAQELKTLRPVSAKRLDAQLALARRESGRAA
jgi:ATP-dependent helicase HrpA